MLAAQRHNWTVVTGIPQDFYRHGYCATQFDGEPAWEQSYFVPVSRAVTKGNLEGAFHPNAKGQRVNFRRTMPLVCAALYGNQACDGNPPPP